ncbi:MAG: XdhC family protein, partial [Phycisphaerales bacterium]
MGPASRGNGRANSKIPDTMDDLGIFEKAASLLEAGQNVALLTVTATTGSAPGKAGYKMLVWAPEGRTLGTVGGGLNESEMIGLAEKMLAKPSSEVRRFELTGGPDEERGICGGSIEFLVESFDGRWQPLFEALTAGAGGGEEVVLVSTIEAGKPPRKVLLKSPF